MQSVLLQLRSNFHIEEHGESLNDQSLIDKPSQIEYRILMGKLSVTVTRPMMKQILNSCKVGCQCQEFSQANKAKI